MYLRLNLIQKKWKRLLSEKAEGDDIIFVRSWVDSLHYQLLKHKNDKDFVTDLIDSSYRFYDQHLTDNEKVDAFVYMLGKIHRR